MTSNNQSLLATELSTTPQGQAVARVFIDVFSKTLDFFGAWEAATAEAKRQGNAARLGWCLAMDLLRIGPQIATFLSDLQRSKDNRS